MSIDYPSARIDEVTDTLSGVSFPDPYRWLEDNSDEVRQWQRTQAAFASAHVRRWPHFERLRALVERFNTERERFITLPRYCAGKWFRVRVAEGASHAQVVAADEPLGEGRMLFDAATEFAEQPPFISWIAPSPDGRTLALGICADGSENNTIRLIDVASGRSLAHPPPQTLMDNWTGGVQWLPDSNGFFFSALTGAATEFQQAIYLHRRDPSPTTVSVEIPWTTLKEYRNVIISRDGAYAVAFERLQRPIPVAVAALGGDTLRWRPFVTSAAGTVAGDVAGGLYIAVTDVGAPRGRLVAIPLDADRPDDPQSWRELVGESDAVMRKVTLVGDALYLMEFIDTYARIRIFDLEGNELGEVPLPGRGAIVSELPWPMMNLTPRGHSEQFLFAFSSLTVGPGIYRHTPGQKGIETLQAPKVRLENTIVEDCLAVSADGTRIPYHVVRRADVSAARPQPTLLYAYGGYNAPVIPQFPGPVAAFIAAGGVFVHAHLRGGGEFGREWWDGGRLGNKQNCYDDLYSVAEHLIAEGRSTPQLLAVTGHSNGGLMAGVAVTQRPQLWKVVVPRVPWLDLIGGARNAYGRNSMRREYANIDDPDEVRRLASFSPYHLVRDCVKYPAIFIDAGDTDPRCPPWHARKFAARLQAATAGSAPILLHVWENAGHDWATDKKIQTEQYSEWLAFTLSHLGVEDWEES